MWGRFQGAGTRLTLYQIPFVATAAEDTGESGGRYFAAQAEVAIVLYKSFEGIRVWVCWCIIWVSQVYGYQGEISGPDQRALPVNCYGLQGRLAMISGEQMSRVVELEAR